MRIVENGNIIRWVWWSRNNRNGIMPIMDTTKMALLVVFTTYRPCKINDRGQIEGYLDTVSALRWPGELCLRQQRRPGRRRGRGRWWRRSRPRSAPSPAADQSGTSTVVTWPAVHQSQLTVCSVATSVCWLSLSARLDCNSKSLLTSHWGWKTNFCRYCVSVLSVDKLGQSTRSRACVNLTVYSLQCLHTRGVTVHNVVAVLMC